MNVIYIKSTSFSNKKILQGIQGREMCLKIILNTIGEPFAETALLKHKLLTY